MVLMFLETYLELLLSSVLNVHTSDEWNALNGAERLSLTVAIAYLVVAPLCILYYASFYFSNREMFSIPEFRERFGVVLDGAKLEHDRVMEGTTFLLPKIFLSRRTLFTFSVIFD